MSPETGARSRKILVVDDAPLFLELQSLFLSRHGRVLTACSGQEGLDLARRHRPDLVLLDLFMPGLDGEEVCRELRRDPLLHDTPVIVLTGSTSADDHERVVRAGANQVLSKPLSRPSLVDAVNRYLSAPVPRGMPRVEIRSPVRIRRADDEHWGEARNVSRGGIFVETPCQADPADEVCLEFALPKTRYVLTPTAQVVWRRQAEPRPGLGLRFVRLDGRSARCLQDFVQERFHAPI